MANHEKDLFFTPQPHELRLIRAYIDRSGMLPRTFYRSTFLRAAGAFDLADAVVADRADREALPGNVKRRSTVDTRLTKAAPSKERPAVSFKVPDDERAIIVAAVEATGYTVKDWCRLMALLAVGEIELADRVRAEHAELMKQIKRLDRRAA